MLEALAFWVCLLVALGAGYISGYGRGLDSQKSSKKRSSALAVRKIVMPEFSSIDLTAGDFAEFSVRWQDPEGCQRVSTFVFKTTDSGDRIQLWLGKTCLRTILFREAEKINYTEAFQELHDRVGNSFDMTDLEWWAEEGGGNLRTGDRPTN